MVSHLLESLSFLKPKSTLVIYLTGLAEINRLIEIQADNAKAKGSGEVFNSIREMEQCTLFITDVLDRLISQLPLNANVKVNSFDPAGKKQSLYERILLGVINKSKFKDRIIELSFQNEEYQAENSEGFVLNFAGTEINDVDLLNNPDFIDISLYGYNNPEEREAFLANLKLMMNTQTKKLEEPFFVYGTCPIDRRDYYILSRTPYEIYYVDRLQYENANRALHNSGAEEEKKARAFLKGLNIQQGCRNGIRLLRSEAEKFITDHQPHALVSTY